jgi:hydroxymethylpyrimidine kinase/phosphomethylpyrimidine kinase
LFAHASEDALAKCLRILGFLLRVHDTGVMNSSQMRRRDDSASATESPVVVTVGGVDPSAAAGIGRDLLTASDLGAVVRLVGTAWTEQNAAGVGSVEARSADAVEQAMRIAVRSPVPGAVKIGMIPGPAVADALVRGLEGYAGPVVVDPVLAASSGGALWQGPLEALWPILRRATLVTPNAPEAAVLAGRPVESLADARAAATTLRAAGIQAVLIKGGHLRNNADGSVTDLLVTSEGEHTFMRARSAGPSPRGTGCALSTAIAVGLASGRPLAVAVGRATSWLAARIANAVDLDGARRLRSPLPSAGEG